MTVIATDAFTNTNGTQLTAHDSTWVLNNGDFDIQSNQLAPDAGGNELLAHWNATFTDNQYSQCLLNAAADSSNAIGVSVRCDASAHTGYGVYCTSGASLIWKIVAGSWTQLGSNATRPTNTDTMKLDVSGTTLDFLINGTSDTTRTDSAITSGMAGVSGYGSDAGASFLIDDWEGGDDSSVGGGRIMSSLANHGGLAGYGGIAGQGGGLAG